MTMLFVNGSPNKDGNTAALAKALFGGKDYETVNLTDYRIGLFGQELDGDQFHEVIGRIREADVVALGSPMYWHNLCASVHTMMERCYGDDYAADLGGKLVLLFQGGAPRAVDARSRRVHGQAFRRAAAYGVSGHGHDRGRSPHAGRFAVSVKRR